MTTEPTQETTRETAREAAVETAPQNPASGPAPGDDRPRIGAHFEFAMQPRERIEMLQLALDTLTLRIVDQERLLGNDTRKIRALQDHIRLIASQIRSYEKLEELKKNLCLRAVEFADHPAAKRARAESGAAETAPPPVQPAPVVAAEGPEATQNGVSNPTQFGASEPTQNGVSEPTQIGVADGGDRTDASMQHDDPGDRAARRRREKRLAAGSSLPAPGRSAGQKNNSASPLPSCPTGDTSALAVMSRA